MNNKTQSSRAKPICRCVQLRQGSQICTWEENECGDSVVEDTEAVDVVSEEREHEICMCLPPTLGHQKCMCTPVDGKHAPKWIIDGPFLTREPGKSADGKDEIFLLVKPPSSPSEEGSEVSNKTRALRCIVDGTKVIIEGTLRPFLEDQEPTPKAMVDRPTSPTLASLEEHSNRACEPSQQIQGMLHNQVMPPGQQFQSQRALFNQMDVPSEYSQHFDDGQPQSGQSVYSEQPSQSAYYGQPAPSVCPGQLPQSVYPDQLPQPIYPEQLPRSEYFDQAQQSANQQQTFLPAYFDQPQSLQPMPGYPNQPQSSMPICPDQAQPGQFLYPGQQQPQQQVYCDQPQSQQSYSDQPQSVRGLPGYNQEISYVSGAITPTRRAFNVSFAPLAAMHTLSRSDNEFAGPNMSQQCFPEPKGQALRNQRQPMAMQTFPTNQTANPQSQRPAGQSFPIQPSSVQSGVQPVAYSQPPFAGMPSRATPVVYPSTVPYQRPPMSVPPSGAIPAYPPMSQAQSCYYPQSSSSSAAPQAQPFANQQPPVSAPYIQCEPPSHTNSLPYQNLAAQTATYLQPFDAALLAASLRDQGPSQRSSISQRRSRQQSIADLQSRRPSCS